MIIEILLAATLSGSAAAAPAPATAVSTSALTAADLRFSARCARTPLAVDDLLSDPAFRADLEHVSGEESGDLLEYSACRFLQGAPGGCGALDGLDRGLKRLSTQCRTMAGEARFAFAALRGGDALPACRSMLALEAQKGPSAERDCAAVVALVRAEGPVPSCASFKRENLVAPRESCEEARAFWSGSASDCDIHPKDSSARRVCRAHAALVAGLREPGRCASSPFCQALSAKAPGACDGLRARFSSALCGRVAADAAAATKRAVREQEIARLAAVKEREAQAAAAAAQRAKAEAALVRAKADAAAAQEKVSKLAAAQAAKKAASEAAVRAKADAEARKDAEAKAKIRKMDRPQFSKGAPMQAVPPEAAAALKAVQEGRPLLRPKAKTPADGD
jgi:hypothetical protein